MRNLKSKLTILMGSLIILLSLNTYGQREMEYLNRGVVAVRTSSSQVFVSWRMLGTEYGQNASYNLYRGETLIASNLEVTNYVDNSSATGTYSVSAVIGGEEQKKSATAVVWSDFYTTVPISAPSNNHHANDASVGDLDGDGDYEIVLKWEANNSKDNSLSGVTDVVYLDGMEMDGTRKWRINLGKNIRAGAHYTQFMVYDLDGDGIAEIACKTAPGTKDGTGSYLSKGPAASDDDGADYRNSSGYILSGPEYLTIFNGETGAEMVTTNYVPARGSVSSWGDSYGNRVDRFLACIAYLDGTKPSLVMCRGYYTRTVIAAWDWGNGSLTHRWTFDTNDGYASYAGQGNHGISVADVDNDGKDEIIYGAMAVDDNGKGLWNSKLGHGDAMHVSDIDPNRPGLEKWGIHEGSSNTAGSALLDARTGEIIWKTGSGDVGRGAAADISADYPGMECWGGTDGARSATNSYVGSAPYGNFVIWWDGDLSRELCDADRIDKWVDGDRVRLVSIYDYENSATNNSTKKNPCLQADILGDWREELITRSSDNTKLIIFTTTSPSDVKMYTLMHDPVYRLGVAWQNVAYNQPPHTGFFLGNGMSEPPVPNIKLIGGTSTKINVTLTSPSNGSAFDAPADINLSADASTSEGSISKVEFFQGSTSLGVDNSAPYSIDWSNVPVGSYKLTAVATNNEGISSTSSAINITVNIEGVINLTIQENENGFVGYDGVIEADNGGFTGDGYVNTDNASGKGIDWEICVPEEGTYALVWKYANGGSDNRTAQLEIDGSVKVSNVSFPSTGSWTGWYNSSAENIILSPGAHQIRLEATNSSGLANIDYISITGYKPQAGTCSNNIAVTGVGVLPTTITVNVGATTQLKSTVSPSNASNKNVSWISGNSSVASVSATGLVTGVAEGSTTITVTTADGGFAATSNISVAGTSTQTYALTTTINGQGSVAPSSGTFDANESVTLTATAATGWQFVNWGGDANGTSATTTITMDGNKSVTANFEAIETGGGCDSPLAISLPFTQEGIGEYCWKTSGDILYINSWGLEKLEVNSTDFTNTWSGDLPAKQDGYYNIHYVSKETWGHFEIASTKSTKNMDNIAENTSGHKINLYPNPVDNQLNIHLKGDCNEFVDIYLFDATGKTVKKVRTNGAEYKLDMSGLPKGFYQVRILGTNMHVEEHVIKQ